MNECSENHFLFFSKTHIHMKQINRRIHMHQH